MDLIPKLAIRNARETFHPLFSSQKYHQRNRTLPKIVARGGDIDRGPSGDSIQKASLIGTTLVHRTCTRNNIVDKKEHTLEKRKVPSVTPHALNARTKTGKQSGKRSLSFISPRPRLFIITHSLLTCTRETKFFFLKLFFRRISAEEATERWRQHHEQQQRLIRIIQFEIGRSTVSRRMIVSSCVLDEAVSS